MGISPGFLKTLLNQFASDEDYGESVGTTKRTATSICVTLGSLLARWRGMALPDSSLWRILMTGRLLELPGAPGECELYRFLAIACGLLGNVRELPYPLCLLSLASPTRPYSNGLRITFRQAGDFTGIKETS